MLRRINAKCMQLEAKAVSFSNPFFKGYCWFIHQRRRCILWEIVQQPSLLENRAMSMHPQPIGPVPEDTARVARGCHGPVPKAAAVYYLLEDQASSTTSESGLPMQMRRQPCSSSWSSSAK